ncbi:hypothetical protein [Dactylosporangium sp. NPDC049140]|uniref:hypothetical protein n=1 Tax=Dactylosporangium sp. NPDC049140 TaxID=3155647 RepID=UPI0033D76651
MDHDDVERRDHTTAPIGGTDPTTGSKRLARAPRRAVTVAATAAAVVAIVATGAAVAGRIGNHATTQLAGPAPTAALGLTESAGAADSRDLLERFADDLIHGPADPVRDRFEYISARIWDPAAAPSAASPDGAGPAVRRTQLWTTGRADSRTVELDETHGCRLIAEQTGNELGPFDGPMSSDPDAVRRQILHEPVAPGAVPDVWGQVAGLYSQRFVPLATRQGILRMLARQPGVSVQPQLTDRAGRIGVGVTWMYKPPMPFTVAKTLIFDAASGRLLASHSRTQRRPGATPPSDPTGGNETYLLMVTSTYTPDVHTPTVGCS